MIRASVQPARLDARSHMRSLTKPTHEAAVLPAYFAPLPDCILTPDHKPTPPFTTPIPHPACAEHKSEGKLVREAGGFHFLQSGPRHLLLNREKSLRVKFHERQPHPTSYASPLQPSNPDVIETVLRGSETWEGEHGVQRRSDSREDCVLK